MTDFFIFWAWGKKNISNFFQDGFFCFLSLGLGVLLLRQQPFRNARRIFSGKYKKFVYGGFSSGKNIRNLFHGKSLKLG